MTAPAIDLVTHLYGFIKLDIIFATLVIYFCDCDFNTTNNKELKEEKASVVVSK